MIPQRRPMVWNSRQAILSLVTISIFVCGGTPSWATETVQGPSISTATPAHAPGAISAWDLAWQFQTAAEGARSRILQVLPHLSRKTTRTIYEVIGPFGRKSFAPEHLDRYGQPLGDAGAQRQADIELRTQKALGFPSTVIERRVLPQVTLYVLSDAGVLQVIDAETGRLLKNLTLGAGTVSAGTIGASEDYLAVALGSRTWLISLSDFKILHEWLLPDVPGKGLILRNNHLYVCLDSGGVLRFEIEASGRFPTRIFSAGRNMGELSGNDELLSWTNDRGQLIFLDVATGKVRFRLESRSRMESAACHGAKQTAYVAATDGYVVAVDAARGNLLWQTMTGDPINTSPILLQDQLMVVSQSGNLICLDPRDGSRKFQVSGVRQVAAATPTELIAVDAQGKLIALARHDGTRHGTWDVRPERLLFTNSLTDRVYLTNGKGLIRCLRPANAIWPTFHTLVDASAGVIASDSGQTAGKSTKESAVEKLNVTTETPDSPATPSEETEADDDPFGEIPDESSFGEEDGGSP